MHENDCATSKARCISGCVEQTPEIQPPHREIAPSVKALLAIFHEETPHKLALAPTRKAPVFHGADGVLRRVVDGWISDSDAELDRADTITITPTNVRDIEEP